MRFSKASFIGVLVVVLVFGLAAASWGQEFGLIEGVKITKGPRYAPGEFLVKFKRGVPDGLIKQINKEHGVPVLAVSKWDKLMRLRVPKGKSVGQMVATYAKNPHVKYAEPNFIRQAFLKPNDTYYYPYQWHLDNVTYGGIGMEEAWDIAPQGGSESVVVAVLDTGLAYNDLEFTDKPVNIQILPGSDIINNDNDPSDDYVAFGHGTHVTGTIAQNTNNNLGVAGVAWNTTIMPVKVLGADGYGSDFQVEQGIRYAADHGAKVINMSLGGEGYSPTLEQACDYAHGKGVTIVCAAGNAFNEGNAPQYPAAYDQYCIAVGATCYDETRTSYSNTGNYLDLVAPGGDGGFIWDFFGWDGVLQQTYEVTAGWDYYFVTGTSMATPHVSGVAALVIAHKGDIGPDRVRECLEGSAEDLGPEGWDAEFGWGLVDAFAALTYTLPTTKYDVAVTGITATPSNVIQGVPVQVQVTVANYGDSPESFNVELWDNTYGEKIGGPTPVNLAQGAGTTVDFTWDTGTATPGEHVLEGKAILSGDDVPGNNAMLTSTPVTVQPQPVHDVAVIAIDAPASAAKGAQVDIKVTVKNEGTSAETTTVTLSESPNNYDFTSQAKDVTLQPGNSTEVTFSWDTSAASNGTHTLTAHASTVLGESDASDNSMLTTVDITDLTLMHVESISMALNTRVKGKSGTSVNALATVTIRDADGKPVKRAAVSGSWSGATYDSDTGATNKNGEITLSSDALKNPSGQKTFTFTVTTVEKTGYFFDDSTGETTDSITYP